MKKILQLITLFTLIATGASAQSFIKDVYNPGRSFSGIKAQKILIPPVYNTVGDLPAYPARYGSDSTHFAIAAVKADSSFYYYVSPNWFKLAQIPVGVVKYADTASMLAPYIRDVYESNDSVYVVTASGSRHVFVMPSGAAAEADPVFTGSPAYSITSGDISNWNTAYGWGNHAGLYPQLSGSYSNPSWITSLDYSKITGAPAPYTLPTASSTVLGGVKVGSGLAIDGSGVLSASGGSGGSIKPAALDGYNSKHARGYQLSNDSLYLQSADANFAGLVDTLTQSFKGEKRFTSPISLPNYNNNNAGVGFYLRNNGGTGDKVGIGKGGGGTSLGNMHFFGLEDYTTFRFYGGGEFDPPNSVANWLAINKHNIITGVPLILNHVLTTWQSGSNTANEIFRFRGSGLVSAAGQNRYGTGALTNGYYSDDAYGNWVWYGGGAVSTAPTDRWFGINKNIVYVGHGNASASARFQVFSTTQGTIPHPVQTTAQWNAIASKAVGLGSYDSNKKQIVQWDGTTTFTYGRIYTGTAAPTTTPLSIGDEFLDTTNKKLYKAFGTASSADWIILN